MASWSRMNRGASGGPRAPARTIFPQMQVRLFAPLRGDFRAAIRRTRPPVGYRRIRIEFRPFRRSCRRLRTICRDLRAFIAAFDLRRVSVEEPFNDVKGLAMPRARYNRIPRLLPLAATQRSATYRQQTRAARSTQLSLL
jgi:hypothetical protein